MQWKENADDAIFLSLFVCLFVCLNGGCVFVDVFIAILFLDGF